MTKVSPVVVLVGSTPSSLVSVEIGNNNRFTEQIFGVAPSFCYVDLPNWIIDPTDSEYRWELIQEKDLRPSEVDAWMEVNLAGFVTELILDKLAADKLSPAAVKLFGVDDGNIPENILELIGTTLEELFPSAMEFEYDDDLQDNPPKAHSPNPDVLKMFMGELSIGTRAYRMLRRAGISTVGDLVAKSEWDIEGIPGIGKLSMQEITHALTELNLSLREE